MKIKEKYLHCQECKKCPDKIRVVHRSETQVTVQEWNGEKEEYELVAIYNGEDYTTYHCDKHGCFLKSTAGPDKMPHNYTVK